MTKIKYLLILVFAFICSLTAFKLTHSYFSDTEKVLGNSIQVGTWGTAPVATPEITITPVPTGTPSLETPTPTPTEIPTQTPTPTNTPTPTPTNTPTPASPVAGNVVINEVMWMGSTVSEHLDVDEWIELRNTTGNPIDLTGWKIDGAGSGSDSITLSGTISTSGFSLLSHYSSDHSAINDSISIDQVIPGLSLANGGEQLTLKDVSNNIIDQTPSGVWVAGVNGTEKQSMERNDTPGDGTSFGSWHTCLAAACHSTTYWDVDGLNWGTPKAPNL